MEASERPKPYCIRDRDGKRVWEGDDLDAAMTEYKEREQVATEEYTVNPEGFDPEQIAADAAAQAAALEEEQQRAESVKTRIRAERDALVQSFKDKPNSVQRVVADLVMFAKYGDQLEEFRSASASPTP